jgi:hypothetical protein
VTAGKGVERIEGFGRIGLLGRGVEYIVCGFDGCGCGRLLRICSLLLEPAPLESLQGLVCDCTRRAARELWTR